MKNPHLAFQMAKANLTGRQLACRAGIHHLTISRLLNNRQATTQHTADRIANAIGCSVADLSLAIYVVGKAAS